MARFLNHWLYWKPSFAAVGYRTTNWNVFDLIPRGSSRSKRRGLTRDLDVATGRNTRGVIALSVSRAVNTGERLYRASTWAAMADGLTKEIRKLVEPYPWSLIQDQRIIGSIFHIITPGVIEDRGTDHEVLRALFMADRSSG
jgi:hypothetical protein